MRKSQSRAAKHFAAESDAFALHMGDDEFPDLVPRGPRRFPDKAPLWKRLVARPSLFFGPILVGGAVSAFLVNALMLQNGARGSMTLGWPFSAISKSSIEKLNSGKLVTPFDSAPVPVPPKRSDHVDPYAALIKDAALPTPPAGDPAIERAQRVLNRLGYGPVPVDGQISAQTRAAVQRFGRDHGLTTGPQTETAILKQLGRAGDTAQD